MVHTSTSSRTFKSHFLFLFLQIRGHENVVHVTEGRLRYNQGQVARQKQIRGICACVSVAGNKAMRAFKSAVLLTIYQLPKSAVLLTIYQLPGTQCARPALPPLRKLSQALEIFHGLYSEGCCRSPVAIDIMICGWPYWEGQPSV